MTCTCSTKIKRRYKTVFFPSLPNPTTVRPDTQITYLYPTDCLTRLIYTIIYYDI